MKRVALPFRVSSVALAVGLAVATRHAHAQTCDSIGPDVIVGDLASPANYNTAAGLDAFAVGGSLCNIGSLPAIFEPSSNQHPIMTQNLYRLRTFAGSSRFEQIGMSWVFHTFFPLNNQLCCTQCEPTGGASLGVRCADPSTGARMGTQGSLGPRHQVNAAVAAFPYPPANPPYNGSVARRLQARISDLDPAQNGGGLYFVEIITLSPDDTAAGNALNNASCRRVSINNVGGANGWNMLLAAPTQRGRSAPLAWRDNDPSVVVSQAAVPADGAFIIGARVSRLGPSTWHYEYAIQNLNSDRSARSVSVPLSPGSRTAASDIGFHDVDYHDGDGGGNVNFDGADWPGVLADDQVSWSTASFSANPNANALRWGTLYNVRFAANAPPATGALTLGLFKPGSPDTVLVPGLPVPGLPCLVDWNADGTLNSQDFFDFLADFFTLSADFNHDDATDSQDFFDFLAAFFGEC